MGAVLVAAGASRRFGGSGNKALEPLAGAAVLCHAARALGAAAGHLVVVARRDEHAAIEAALRADGLRADAIVTGGAERADSVRAGLAALDPAAAIALVHDAARPLVLADDVRRVAAAARAHGAALLVEAMVDTVKHSADGRFSDQTLDRERLWHAQTPQGFERARLEALHAAAATEGHAPTDDAALWERAGGRVALVVAAAPNFKITRAVDLLLADAVLRARQGATGGKL